MPTSLEVSWKIDLKPLALQMPGRFGFGVGMGLHHIPTRRQIETHLFYPLLTYQIRIIFDNFMSTSALRVGRKNHIQIKGEWRELFARKTASPHGKRSIGLAKNHSGSLVQLAYPES